MTVLGTRPEIVRLSRVIEKLDRRVEHLLVDTGQNADPRLKEVIYRDLGVRRPDYDLQAQGDTFGQQVARIFARVEQVLIKEKPDRMLVLGDTNSGLSALLAKRMGVAVFHMEAGNRCFDERVAEEVNRRVIDHSSDVLLPYTERARENLTREGVDQARILVTGNPILEVMRHCAPGIDGSDVLARLNLEARGYFLVTIHRQETVDAPRRLALVLTALDRVRKEHGLPVVCSVHPRTRDRMARGRLDGPREGVAFHEPFGVLDFLSLERNALVVLTDSGTVQEECCIVRVPGVVLRDATERPETVECGSSLLCGVEPGDVCRGVGIALAMARDWRVPDEYLVEDVSERVVDVLACGVGGSLRP